MLLASLVILLAGCGVAAPQGVPRPTPQGATGATATPSSVILLPTPTTRRVTPTQGAAVPTLATPTSGSAAPATPSSGPSRVVEYGTSGRREIALTFDAGADRGYAEEILDLLHSEGVPASFGMMGQWAEANPDLVGRMVNEGHMLFNHSWSHPSFTGATTGSAPLTREERLAEVEKTEAVVRALTGYDLRPYFRPPFGDYDDSVLADLSGAGYGVTLLWSCDSRDSLGATADQILANCIDQAAPGRIVLLHVGAQSAASEALPRIIASLRAQGFAFVTVEDLLQP